MCVCVCICLCLTVFKDRDSLLAAALGSSRCCCSLGERVGGEGCVFVYVCVSVCVYVGS